jgi:hypothetical protein
MIRLDVRPYWNALQAKSLPVVVILIIVNLLFNIIANAGFMNSAFSPSLGGFLSWQVIGNIAGFLTVLTLTALFRFIPLHVAFTITTGLAVIGVQVVAAGIFFRETITPVQ